MPPRWLSACSQVEIKTQPALQFASGGEKALATQPSRTETRPDRLFLPRFLRDCGSLGVPLFNRDVGKDKRVSYARALSPECNRGQWSMRPCVWGMRLCNLSSTTGLGLRYQYCPPWGLHGVASAFTSDVESDRPIGPAVGVPAAAR